MKRDIDEDPGHTEAAGCLTCVPPTDHSFGRSLVEGPGQRESLHEMLLLQQAVDALDARRHGDTETRLSITGSAASSPAPMSTRPWEGTLNPNSPAGCDYAA